MRERNSISKSRASQSEVSVALFLAGGLLDYRSCTIPVTSQKQVTGNPVLAFRPPGNA